MIANGRSIADAAARYGFHIDYLRMKWHSCDLKHRSTAREKDGLADYYKLTPGGRGDKLAIKFVRGKL